MATATQIMQHDDSIDQRPQKCLEILLRAEKEADEITADVLSVIAKHDAKGVQLKAEAASLHAARGEKQHIRRNVRNNHGGTQGTRPHIVDDDSSIDEDDESDDSGLPKTQAGEEHLHKSRALQQRLRDCYLTLHRVKFLQGDMFHWIGKSKGAEEATSYKAAEETRSKILQCAFRSYRVVSE
jgi:E3 ubiquitin-protein ligase SHPRH